MQLKAIYPSRQIRVPTALGWGLLLAAALGAFELVRGTTRGAANRPGLRLASLDRLLELLRIAGEDQVLPATAEKDRLPLLACARPLPERLRCYND